MQVVYIYIYIYIYNLCVCVLFCICRGVTRLKWCVFIKDLAWLTWPDFHGNMPSYQCCSYHRALYSWWYFKSSPPGQNGRHLAGDIFKCIFLNENVPILLEISLKFVPMVQINNIPALVQIMAWRWPGDKPLSEPMLTQFTDVYMQH